MRTRRRSYVRQDVDARPDPRPGGRSYDGIHRGATNNVLEGWSVYMNMTDMSAADGALQATTTSHDPAFAAPPFDLRVGLQVPCRPHAGDAEAGTQQHASGVLVDTDATGIGGNQRDHATDPG